MKCAFTKKELSYYFDNECDDKTRDMITAHIQNCKKCKNELKYYCAIRNKMEQISEVEPSNEYMDSFQEKLKRISSGNNEKKKIIPLFKKPFFKISTSVAALLLLFIGTRFLLKPQNEQIKYNPLITYLKGIVFIAGETTSPRLALVNDKIIKGQTIATGPHSKIDIELKKAFRFTLKENTVLSIEELTDTQNRITVICRLKRGGVLADVEKRNNPSNIKVITALADISVKGTCFLVEASPKSKGGNVKVSVLRGKVEVVHKNTGAINGQNEVNNIYMLTENEKISFQPKKTTAFKTELTAQDIENFWEIYEIGHRDIEIKYQQTIPSTKTDFQNTNSLK
ncbi:FecR domain-containing protein [bacterium]|nr:FecR domain-containing protein [bacterium]